MNTGSYVFAQMVKFLDEFVFLRIVKKYDGDKYIKHFSCWNQLLTLMQSALEIIKKTGFNLPILRYPSGKSGYNKKIKQLLEVAGINRKVAVFDEAAGENKYLPLYEVGSSKLARKTHVDLMNKVQVDLYAASFHRQGSKAVQRYTMLELKDRFALMCAAFGEEQYKVGGILRFLTNNIRRSLGFFKESAYFCENATKMGKLLEFRAKNFRSIGSNQVLSLLPSTRHGEYPDNIMADGKWPALGTIAIYGANSGGKSNLLQAIRLMKNIIAESAKLSSTDALPYEPFLLRDGYDKMDTEFELTFTEGENRYRYGFSYNRSAVHKEWLCRKAVGRETSLFEREGDTIETSNGFQGNGRLIDTAIEATKENSLFLSVCDMFNIESAKKVMDWLNNLIVIDAQHPEQFRQDTISMMKRPGYKEKISGFLSSLDMNILDLSLTQVGGAEKVLARHVVYDENANPTEKTRQWLWDEHESTGSTKALMMSGPVLWVLATGGCLVADEIGASMHPIMTLKTVETFLSKESNKNDAQLIFATHDTNLLTYAKLRRDQIYFVEKNDWESSELFSLSDFKYIGEKDGVAFSESERPDTDKEKRYIEGRYGAIPALGSFGDYMKRMVWQKEEK